MKYYKIMNGTTFVGAVNSNNFVAKNPKTGWLLTSNEILGQFVDYNGQLYRDYWMQPIPNNDEQFLSVNIEEIEQSEYNNLIEAIENHQPIPVEEEEDEPIEEIIEEPTEPDELLEYVREGKINEMSRACRETIEAGFDLELHGETQHFSLTTQDQLNLMSLSMMAQTQSLIPYHADGQETTFYTSDEINEIIQTATDLKIYNTTYFNALKGYINSLETIEEIGAITYGTPIPEEYKSDVLKVLE